MEKNKYSSLNSDYHPMSFSVHLFTCSSGYIRFYMKRTESVHLSLAFFLRSSAAAKAKRVINNGNSQENFYQIL